MRLIVTARPGSAAERHGRARPDTPKRPLLDRSAPSNATQPGALVAPGPTATLGPHGSAQRDGPDGPDLRHRLRLRGDDCSSSARSLPRGCSSHRRRAAEGPARTSAGSTPSATRGAASGSPSTSTRCSSWPSTSRSSSSTCGRSWSGSCQVPGIVMMGIFLGDPDVRRALRLAEGRSAMALTNDPQRHPRPSAPHRCGTASRSSFPTPRRATTCSRPFDMEEHPQRRLPRPARGDPHQGGLRPRPDPRQLAVAAPLAVSSCCAIEMMSTRDEQERHRPLRHVPVPRLARGRRTC